MEEEALFLVLAEEFIDINYFGVEVVGILGGWAFKCPPPPPDQT
jgi:hypothetical protein